MKANKEQHQGADSISGDRQIINRIIRPGKMDTKGFVAAKDAATVTREMTAFTFRLVETSFFSFP